MDERKRILKLVEDGTISADEAIQLLEALSKQKDSTPSSSPSTYVEPVQEKNEWQQSTFEQEKKRKTTGFEDLFSKLGNKDLNKKMDELMHELRHDLSEFSGRMMTLMNTTLSKVKDLDVEFPFGEKVEFDKTYAFNAEEVRGFEIDIPNGRVTIEKGTAPTIQIEAHVKTSKNGTEQEATDRFTERFVELKDGKIEVATQAKMAHVALRVVLPEKHYDVLIVRLLNGGITLNDIDAKIVKVKTYNGNVIVEHATFEHADLQSANGAIEARHISGQDLEAETANGRVYIDGDVKEVEAESVNGHVVVTTTSTNAHKVKARTVAGSVEIYVPKNVSLDGQVTSNFGRTDVGLADVTTRVEEDQFLLKTLHFDKIITDAPLLKLVGESRTGSIVVRYTTQGE
ncbi:DUF4097 family beta strand repeat-containing protein [Lysinibacillus sp. LZ02]|uniref:DUF4097 family beta strand repeat-containing protein n=1 Tax=Lysinibacillus sp. LZ02 TaxID=3420668 RepID=UPI003D36C567